MRAAQIISPSILLLAICLFACGQEIGAIVANREQAVVLTARIDSLYPDLIREFLQNGAGGTGLNQQQIQQQLQMQQQQQQQALMIQQLQQQIQALQAAQLTTNTG